MIIGVVSFGNRDIATEISFIVTADTNKEKISCWSNNKNDYYVFLPAYSDLSKTIIAISTEDEILIDGICVSDGMIMDRFQMNTAYRLDFLNGNKYCGSTITFLKANSIAAMHIDIDSGSSDYVNAKKDNVESAWMRLYDYSGKLNFSGRVASISGRGNSTWQYFDKKPYSLNLEYKSDLLDMGAAEKWILLANAADPSNMRNKVVYDFAKEARLSFSPESKWVDLYLNGEYAGLYLLSEKNEIHPERVAILEGNSFLVSMDKLVRLMDQDDPYVVTKSKQALRIHQSNVKRTDDSDFILEIMQSVENAILDCANWSEIEKLIDIDSWATKYLIDEVFANYDSNAKSNYFYYFDDAVKPRVYSGPVWDYDLSMGSDEQWQFVNPNALYANRLYERSSNCTPWMYLLYQRPEFYNILVDKYEKRIKPELQDLIERGLDNNIIQIENSSEMNSIRWDLDTDLRTEVANIKLFLRDRAEFLSNVWIHDIRYCCITVNPGNDEFFAYYAVTPGDSLLILPDLPENDYQTFVGWYYTDTNEPFDKTVPITEDTEIYAKWEDTPAKRVRQIMKLIPLGVIAVIGFGLLTVEISRIRRVKQT